MEDKEGWEMSDILKPIPFYGDKDGEVGVGKPAASGWISVDSGDFPDFDDAVWVWHGYLYTGYEPHHHQTKARRVKTNDSGNWCWSELNGHNTMLTDVTHWMPLPNPPAMKGAK